MRPARNPFASRISTTPPAFVPFATKRVTLTFIAGFAEPEHVVRISPVAFASSSNRLNAMEATNGIFGWHVASVPRRLVSATSNADQSQAHAVGIRELQYGLSEALLDIFMRHTLLDEAVRPETDRASGMRNIVCWASPTPSSPSAACAHGKNVRIVPGVPSSSPK